MTAANTETDFPEQLGAYIDASREVLGLPTAEALPVVTASTDSGSTYPSIFIVTGKVDLPHRRRMNLQVMVELQTQMESTTVEQEDVWLKGLHRLLNDKDAMCDWLATRTGADAPSFALRKMRLSDVATGVDTEKKIRGRRSEVTVHLRSHELAWMPAV